ncbi:hypothetical protein GCM10027168_24280 [Streptomyces capparidis]
MFEGKAARPKWWSRPEGAGAPGAASWTGSHDDPPPAAPGSAEPVTPVAAGEPWSDGPPRDGAAQPPAPGEPPTAEPAAAEDAAAGRPGPAEPATPGDPAPEQPAEERPSTELPTTELPAARPEDARAEDAHPEGVQPEDARPGAGTGAPYPSSPGDTVPRFRPDPYGTPPYGGPGPWAPAPPVQRPTLHTHPQLALPPQGPPPHQPQPHQTPPHPAPRPAGARPAGPPPAGPAPAGPPLPYAPWQRPALWAQATRPAPAKRRRGPRLAAAAVLIALVAGIAGGGIGALAADDDGGSDVEFAQAPPDAVAERAPDSVAGIASATLPGVVYIHVRGDGRESTGTGFVLDTSGHILTNNHVVESAEDGGEVDVTFNDGEVADARIVGGDSGYDLAVLKVDGVTDLHPLRLGDSDAVQVGDPVVAIGAPYDLEGTVTSGIISAKDRPITAGGEEGSDISYVNALQTDAPINPGNSGGPLVNTKGQVIGINSAIRSADTGFGPDGQGGSIGLGFAIPVNQGKRVAEELINTGHATHPIIGVQLDTRYRGEGARVSDESADAEPVTPGGPAARAGIEPGDVITEVDGEPIRAGEELIVRIRSREPGDTMDLTVVRDGRERQVRVTLGSATGD